MQPVTFTEWKDSWHLKFSDKKKLFGSQRAEHCQKVSDEIDEKLVTRKDDGREPVAYHSQNRDYYVTLILSSWQWKKAVSWSGEDFD